MGILIGMDEAGYGPQLGPLAIAAPEIVGRLRFLDENTLLVEGRAIWTIRLKATEEKMPDSSNPQSEIRNPQSEIRNPQSYFFRFW